jgi:hypothetical protein
MEQAKATGVAAQEQDAAEARAAAIAVVPSIKAVEQAEATGVAVQEQDAAEAKDAAIAVVPLIKAVEQAEATGVAVPVPNMAEATVRTMLATLLSEIKEDAAEKNMYIDISSTHSQQDGITHLAAGCINRTLILFINVKRYKIQVNLSGQSSVCGKIGFIKKSFPFLIDRIYPF